jgi:flagellar export protein FliJ
VLRVRRIREKEARRAHAVVIAERARIDARIGQIDGSIAQQHNELRRVQSADCCDMTGLIAGRSWIASLRRSFARAQADRAEIEQRLEVTSAALREARVAVRVIEKLRERRLAEHQRREAKREQAGLEELARCVLPTVDERVGASPAGDAVWS